MRYWTNSQKCAFVASCCLIIGEIATLMGYNWEQDFYMNFALGYFVAMIFLGATWSKRWFWVFFAWTIFAALVSGLLGGVSHFETPDHWWLKIDAIISILWILVLMVGVNFSVYIRMDGVVAKIYFWLFPDSEKNPYKIHLEKIMEVAKEEKGNF